MLFRSAKPDRPGTQRSVQADTIRPTRAAEDERGQRWTRTGFRRCSSTTSKNWPARAAIETGSRSSSASAKRHSHRGLYLAPGTPEGNHTTNRRRTDAPDRGRRRANHELVQLQTSGRIQAAGLGPQPRSPRLAHRLQAELIHSAGRRLSLNCRRCLLSSDRKSVV